MAKEDRRSGAETRQESMFSKVKERAFAELDNLRPILPEDAKKAQKWKEKYIEDLRAYDFTEQDGMFVVLKDGKPLQDSHGYNKSFADLVKETASEIFDFQTADDRTSQATVSSRVISSRRATKNSSFRR